MRAVEAKSTPVVSGKTLGSTVKNIEIYQLQIAEHRRKLEQLRGELRESYSRYTDLYELAPVGFLSLDKAACIREINAKGAALLGFSVSWLLGRPFLVFIAKNDLPGFLNFLSRSSRTSREENIELMLNGSGHHLPVHISMKSVTTADSVVRRMTLVDLSDVKKTEAQLQRSLDKWLSLVHSAGDVILTVDRTGRIGFANRALWGQSAQSLTEHSIFDYLPKGELLRFRQCFDKAFRSGAQQSCEIGGFGKNRDSWLAFSLSPTGGQPDANTATVIVREISEQKRAEESLRSSGERLRDFAARVDAVREEERKRLAREIHDELGQALTILKLDLSWLHKHTSPDKEEKIQSMMDHVDETIDRMRRIVSELRPSILDDMGLVAAIEWQSKEFQRRTGIVCRLRSSVDDADMDPERAAAVFRVVQEALTNVMRHANAKCVYVNLKKQDGLFKISVIDDGQGIKPKTKAKAKPNASESASLNDAKSLGIVGMRERISRIGGEFKIHSIPGSGTRVEIVLAV